MDVLSLTSLLVGACTHVHTVSFPARRARLRRSAGHTTIYGNKKKFMAKKLIFTSPSNFFYIFENSPCAKNIQLHLGN